MRRMPLLGQTLVIYNFTILLGTLLLIAKNVWVHALSLADLAEYFFGAMAVLNLVFLLLMQTISYVRLRGIHRSLRERTVAKEPAKQLDRLLRFPSELFWSMIVLSALLSVVYHAASWVHAGAVENWDDVLGSLLSEQALAITLAVMVYSLLRSRLRPYLQQLQQTKIARVGRMSAARPLLLCYVSCFVVICFDLLRTLPFALTRGREMDIAAIASIAVVDFAFSLGVFTLVIKGLRDELRDIVGGIRSLSSRHRSELHGAIRVGFPDEPGQLVEAFNAEQERAARRYDRLDEELALADSVQQMLLPERECRIGSFHVRAEGRKREATGEWYDMVTLDQGRFAVAAGVVQGRHMPAALVMSAALVLLRSEIRRSAAAEDALRRLRAEWADLLPADMQIHLGVAVFDPQQAEVRVAAVGAIGVGLLRQGEESGPLPHAAAAEPDDIRSCAWTLHGGDRMTIAVEASASHADGAFRRGRTSDATRVSVHYETG